MRSSLLPHLAVPTVPLVVLLLVLVLVLVLMLMLQPLLPHV
jgi:hypothetical protein